MLPICTLASDSRQGRTNHEPLSTMLGSRSCQRQWCNSKRSARRPLTKHRTTARLGSGRDKSRSRGKGTGTRTRHHQLASGASDVTMAGPLAKSNGLSRNDASHQAQKQKFRPDQAKSSPVERLAQATHARTAIAPQSFTTGRLNRAKGQPCEARLSWKGARAPRR